MAKTGFWLKGSQGKLAGATMYKDGASGETIIREVVKPSNPKTTAQNIQRIIMLTVGQAYSLMKEITDHSFEGVKAGRDTMAYFMKQNIQFCREKLAAMQAEGVDYYDMYNFVPLGGKGFVPNQYQISMGSLPRVDATLNDDAPEKAFVQNIPVDATYAQVISALGLQRGDQLTFMYLRGNATFQNDVQFAFARVILDPTNDDYTPASLDTPFLNANRINKPSVRNEGDFRFSIDANGLGYYAANNGAGAVKPCVAAAVIVSRKIGDSWNRSTAYLTYLPGYNAYSMGDCLDRAAAGVSAPLYSANPLYLNNAGEGGAAVAAGENSEAGQGGSGSSNLPSVSSVTVDGQPVIQGTLKVIEVPADTTFPHNVTVQVTGSNLAGNFVVAKNAATDAEIGASTSITGATTSKTVAIPQDETEVIISIENEDSEAVINTSYRFKISVSADEGTI